MPKTSELAKKSIDWWLKMAKKERMAVFSSEFPNAYQRRFLVKEGFAFSLKQGLWLLKKREEKPKEQFLIHYWQIVAKILAAYQRWAVKDKTAIKLLLGDQSVPEKLTTRISRKVIYTIKLPFGFKILVTYDPNFNLNVVKKLALPGTKIYVDIPEKLLLEYKKMDEDYIRLVKSQSFDKRMLEILYQEKPSPKALERLSQSLSKHRRIDVAKNLQDIAKRYAHYFIPSAPITKFFQKVTTSSDKPWITRQEEQVRMFSEKIEKKFRSRIKKIPAYGLPYLLKQAKGVKQYDIYHSTTIEGYRITPEEVSEALLKYRKDSNIKKTKAAEEKLRNKMAILGYSYAFDFVLAQVQKDQPKSEVTQELVKDIFYQLFKPSADVGILDKFSLTRWRNIQNFIRGSQYVPPSPSKVPDLMNNFETILKKITNMVSKAILSHWLFVSIHPYQDGNGRTARLLMNYVLLCGGYRWITIRAEQRKEYFSALERANLENDILPFANFIINLLKAPIK